MVDVYGCEKAIKSVEIINADIKINGDKIEKISSQIEGEEIFDASGLYVVPGFIDTHMHGANGRNSPNDEFLP